MTRGKEFGELWFQTWPARAEIRMECKGSYGRSVKTIRGANADDPHRELGNYLPDIVSKQPEDG